MNKFARKNYHQKYTITKSGEKARLLIDACWNVENITNDPQEYRARFEFVEGEQPESCETYYEIGGKRTTPLINQFTPSEKRRKITDAKGEEVTLAPGQIITVYASRVQLADLDGRDTQSFGSQTEGVSFEIESVDFDFTVDSTRESVREGNVWKFTAPFEQESHVNVQWWPKA
jgi:hypothetical protein